MFLNKLTFRKPTVLKKRFLKLFFFFKNGHKVVAQFSLKSSAVVPFYYIQTERGAPKWALSKSIRTQSLDKVAHITAKILNCALFLFGFGSAERKEMCFLVVVVQPLFFGGDWCIVTYILRNSFIILL